LRPRAQSGRGRRCVRDPVVVPDGSGQSPARILRGPGRTEAVVLGHAVGRRRRRTLHLGGHRRHAAGPVRTAAGPGAPGRGRRVSRRLEPQPWMTDPGVVAVFDALEAAGGAGCVRFVGGCLRNALSGHPVADVDLATSLRPEAVMAALEAAGLRALPTGLDHGTVTAQSGGRTFEITTLRRDVATDGRRAVVAFTEDWAEDAARRDFRLNALYADRE